MSKMQYLCVGDRVVYRLGKYLYTGYIYDFFKYNNELRVKCRFNIGDFTFRASDLRYYTNFWCIY